MCLRLRRTNAVANDIFYVLANQCGVPCKELDVNWLTVLACSTLAWTFPPTGLTTDGLAQGTEWVGKRWAAGLVVQRLIGKDDRLNRLRVPRAHETLHGNKGPRVHSTDELAHWLARLGFEDAPDHVMRLGDVRLGTLDRCMRPRGIGSRRIVPIRTAAPFNVSFQELMEQMPTLADDAKENILS
eukprot:4930014-Pyramimonas_sp.AAC.1